MSFGIWNNIDEIALYLGISRLPKEDDDSFKDRLYKVSRVMYKPDAYNQIKSINAQCGLEVKPLLQINSSDNFVCSIDYNYFTLQTSNNYLRVFIGRDDIILQTILDGLNKISNIDIILYSPASSGIPVKHIIKNTNFKLNQEFMPDKTIILNNTNIVEGSVEFEDKANFLMQVDGLANIKKNGDYFIDYQTGYIEGKNINSLGQIVKYSYIEKPFIVEYSDIAVTPINHYYEQGVHKDNTKFIPFLLSNNVYGK